VVVLTLTVLEPFAVVSVSMSPTLLPGDQVLIAKHVERTEHPRRADLVVFTRPGSNEHLVKRVAAVAGDEVGLEDGRLVVNGAPVNEDYVDVASVDGTYFGPVVVGPDEVFVLGDNRADSVDSRQFGPVPVSDIIGRVVARLWPRDKR